MTEDLQTRHISELHERAAELDISGYRLLPRAELIEKIEEREKKKGRRRLRLPRRRRKKKEDAAAAAEAPAAKPSPERKPPPSEGATWPASGSLQIKARRYGFLRVEDGGGEKPDVYVSASQIRRCELKEGDVVEGPARDPRRGERHPALVRVERVNGKDLED